MNKQIDAIRSRARGMGTAGGLHGTVAGAALSILPEPARRSHFPPVPKPAQLDYSLGLSNTLLLASPGEELVDAVADPDALDYIEASNELSVAGLIEDEILLCLPFSPRHTEGDCLGLEVVTQNARRDNDVHAFSKLKELKKVFESKR
jgi:hypothetical protein